MKNRSNMLARSAHSSLLLLFILFCGAAIDAAAQPAMTATVNPEANKKIMRAMEDEIRRSLNELSLPGVQKPYYLEYRLQRRWAHNLQATFGSLVESSDDEVATLSVGIRVGDYEFDNSNFFDVSLNFFGTTDDEESFRNRRIPWDVDYDNLRRELWLASDAAYKQAGEIYAKKKAAIENRVRLDTTPDFIPMPAAEFTEIEPIPAFRKDYFTQLITDISAVFRKYPDIALSQVNFEFLPEVQYYLNTEGRRLIKTELFTGLEISAVTQAKDGMPIAQTYTTYSRNPDDLPSRDSLLSVAHRLGKLLTDARDSEMIEPYSGPVLFEDQAAAELFGQIFLPNLATVRAPLSEGGFQDKPRFSAFQNKIGGRVLPEFLSAEVKPELAAFEGTPLVGMCKVDDEGVPTQSFKIIEDGYLQNLMSSRVPTRRVRESNGHQRGGAAMLSTVSLTASPEKTWSTQHLRERMLELCEARELPYGIVVRSALNSNLLITSIYPMTQGDYAFTRGEGVVPLLEAYKVYPDGREELIRGMEVTGISHQSFKDILALGDERYAYNFLASSITSPFYSGGRQYIPVSYIGADVLFEDLEVTPVESDFAKPPILPHPYFSDK